jgi:hypothetical protein
MADLEHENVFRALNERIKLLVATFDAFEKAGTIPFVCECPDATCFAPVELTLTQYEQICATERSRVATPEHSTEAVPEPDRSAY